MNVHLDAELDAELSREALRTGESRAALLRLAARAFLEQRSADDRDGWAHFTGAIDEATASSNARVHDDDTIYG